MIFFDIDGTLLDYKNAERAGILDFFQMHNNVFSFTKEQSIKIWEKLSKKYFERFLANEMSFHEQKRARMIELFKMVHIHLTDQEGDEKFEKYLTLFKKNWKAYSDVLGVLEQLKLLNFPMGIISNGDYEQQVEKLKQIEVEKYFSCVVTSSEVGAAKPDKAIFMEACSRTKSSLENCYYVGDLVDTDALGSKRAGMRGIWLNRLDQQQHSEVIVIRSLYELLDVLI